MADEVRERLPRPDPRRPREPDEDRESDDLASLDERVVEERLNPEVHVEGCGGGSPAGNRGEDDSGLGPDPIQQQMGGDPQSPEAQPPPRGREAECPNSEKEKERVGPEASLEG